MFAANLSKREGQYKYLLQAAFISVVYLLLSYVLVGFRSDQLFLVALFDFLFLLSPVTRRFISGFSIFFVFWILFDYMKAFPNYRYNPVHIESLYDLEKGLFGIRQEGAVVTPNEFWLTHGHTWLDVLCGFFYLCWMPLPLLFAGWLYYAKRPQFFRFSWTFLLTNLIGFVIYYIYPAAPPWYVQLHGFHFSAHTPGNTAGLAKWDQFFGVHIFDALYAKSSNVFAAMPSLHAAYPLLSFYYAVKNKISPWAVALFALITAGIWFTAVYTSHHYVLDVLAGILCALTGITLFNAVAKKQNWFPDRDAGPDRKHKPNLQ
ncbi:MAG: inositol phosphorylceramide synthase [Williamsia sp.]|nr:inositol phosphorylceramide synthase [Williamsia sp.]